MPSLQHDHLHQDMTPDSFTSLGTQPWNTRNCTEEKEKIKRKKKGEKKQKEGQHMRAYTESKRTNQCICATAGQKEMTLSSFCNEVIAKLNSMYLLRPCRMGRIRLKFSIQTKGKKVDFMVVFFSGQVLSQWCDCPAFSVLDIRIYVQFYLCFYFIFFYKKEKILLKKNKEKLLFSTA